MCPRRTVSSPFGRGEGPPTLQSEWERIKMGSKRCLGLSHLYVTERSKGRSSRASVSLLSLAYLL